MCRSYGGSNGTSRGRLGILGGQMNLGSSMESVGVGCGQRNLGVARLYNCRVPVVFFYGGLGVFLDSVR